MKEQHGTCHPDDEARSLILRAIDVVTRLGYAATVARLSHALDALDVEQAAVKAQQARAASAKDLQE